MINYQKKSFKRFTLTLFLPLLVFSFLSTLFYFAPLKTPSFFILISVIFVLLSSISFYLGFSSASKKPYHFFLDPTNNTLFKLKVQSLIEDKIPFYLCYLQVNPYLDIQTYLSQQEKDQVLSNFNTHLEKVLNIPEICPIPTERKKTSQLAYIKEGVYCFLLFSDNKTQTDRLLSPLLKTIPLEIKLDNINLTFHAKFGISHFDKYLPDLIDADKLINQAQQALIHPEDTFCTIHYYDPSRAFHHHFMMSLANDLEHAIDKNQFSLYHQAQYFLKSGTIYGSETLLRWHHPRFGVISPSLFIPLAEKNGFIYKLTDWVLNKAFEQQAQILALSVKHRFSINISALDINRPSFIDSLCHLAKKYQVPLSLLSIELTESVNLKGLDHIQNTIKALSNHDIRLSIDDYGTGYSSLFYLSQLPFSEIKIDKAFIGTLTQDCRQQYIVKSTIDMANALNLTLITEGVEDKKTVQQLAKLGAKIAQGYYFSAPLSFEKYMLYVISMQKKPQEAEKQQTSSLDKL